VVDEFRQSQNLHKVDVVQNQEIKTKPGDLLKFRRFDVKHAYFASKLHNMYQPNLVEAIFGIACTLW